MRIFLSFSIIIVPFKTFFSETSNWFACLWYKLNSPRVLLFVGISLFLVKYTGATKISEEELKCTNKISNHTGTITCSLIPRYSPRRFVINNITKVPPSPKLSNVESNIIIMETRSLFNSELKKKSTTRYRKKIGNQKDWEPKKKKIDSHRK